jgi:hypothetical protein
MPVDAAMLGFGEDLGIDDPTSRYWLQALRTSTS